MNRKEYSDAVKAQPVPTSRETGATARHVSAAQGDAEPLRGPRDVQKTDSLDEFAEAFAERMGPEANLALAQAVIVRNLKRRR